MAGGRKVKIAVIGAGQRGMVYAGYMADNYNEEIVAVVKDFIEGLRFGSADSRSSIDRSVESHIMAYAAEKSRVENKVVIIKDLNEELMTNESWNKRNKTW